MQEGKFKNTIVLKNIPSNIIEEAIIVLKENKKAWKLEIIEKGKKNIEEKKVNPIKKDYIVKEAELIITDYIRNKEKEEKMESRKIKNKKYKILKRYAIFSTTIIMIQLLSNLF